MNYKEFLKINWLDKRQHGHLVGGDIDLSITKRKDRCAFIFRNGSSKPLGEYVEVGVCGELVVFRKAERGVGYKIYERNDGKVSEASVANEIGSKQLDEFIGDYVKLNYNHDFDLYFVRKGDKR